MCELFQSKCRNSLAVSNQEPPYLNPFKAQWEQSRPCPTCSAGIPRTEWREAAGGRFQVDFNVSSDYSLITGVQVMPGFQRAQQNWRRTSNLAARVSLNRPPAGPAPAPGAAALAYLNASAALAAANRPSVAAPPALPPQAFVAAHDGLRHHPVRLFNVRASRGEHPLGPAAGPALPDQLRPFPSFEAMTSDVRSSTPIGRSRQRSRSMTSSPSALLEEYKTRWTCKVT